MSKIWFSVSIICIFVIGVITFVIIDVFSAQPQKLSSESIENLPASIELEVDETYTIEYEILPSNATVCNVFFALCENDFEVIENDYFSILNNTITALAVGNGNVFVYLNNVLFDTIPVVITAKTEQQNPYSFDISLDIDNECVDFNAETNIAFVYSSYFTNFFSISFIININNVDNPTSFWTALEITENSNNIVVQAPYQQTYPNCFALVFNKLGVVKITITNEDYDISTIITINVVE